MNKNILNEINRNREIMGLSPILIEQEELTRKEKRQQRRANKKAEKEMVARGKFWGLRLEGIIDTKSKYFAELVGFGFDNGGSPVTYDIKANSAPMKQPQSQKPGTPPETDVEEITFPKVSLAGASMPYPDNMVKPYFDRYPQAKADFSTIVDKFRDYIDAGGIKNLNNITIQGTADSGTPNRTAPSGFSEIDHDYGGSTDVEEMNLYLAKYRAYWYAEAIKEAVKEKTGQDIVINVLDGISYLGQDNKRGEEWRTITLTPNAPPIKPKPKITTTTTGGEEGERLDVREDKYIDFITFFRGKPKLVKGYLATDDDVAGVTQFTSQGHKTIFVKQTDAESYPTFPENGASAELDGRTADLIVGGTWYGRFDTGDSDGVNDGFEVSNNKNIYEIKSTIKIDLTKEIDGETYVAVQNIQFALSPKSLSREYFDKEPNVSWYCDISMVRFFQRT